jgi:AcrR family transcriptional regulator
MGTSNRGPARDALLDAAVAQLQQKGALAGLNLREVADAAGVTPANIYHLFGSRQGLLREALRREADRLQAPLAVAAEKDFVGRRLHMFDAILDSPVLRLTALLALDGDPEYRPLPFLDATREQYGRMIADGELPDDLDVEALHVLAIATSIAAAIYLEPAARQLEVAPDELRARLRSAFGRLLGAAVDPSRPGDPPAPVG